MTFANQDVCNLTYLRSGFLVKLFCVSHDFFLFLRIFSFETFLIICRENVSNIRLNIYFIKATQRKLKNFFVC